MNLRSELSFGLTVRRQKKKKSSEFRQSGPNSFSRKSKTFKVQAQPLHNRILGTTNLRNCKIACRYKLDTELRRKESAVDCTSTWTGEG